MFPRPLLHGARPRPWPTLLLAAAAATPIHALANATTPAPGRTRDERAWGVVAIIGSIVVFFVIVMVVYSWWFEPTVTRANGKRARKPGDALRRLLYTPLRSPPSTPQPGSITQASTQL
jgi:hypothetical protein